MSAPDYQHGYLRVPLALWRSLYCRAPLTRRQLQLVSVVLRESWGWQSRSGQVRLWTRPLAARDFAAATGLSTDHLRGDLRVLVAFGVLHEREGRYQLVPDALLWKTTAPHATAARKSRPAPRKAPDPGAETALPAPGPKTTKIKERNVAAVPGRKPSPAVDKSGSGQWLLPVIAQFTGGLTAGEQHLLTAWVRESGVAAVWRRLEPGLRLGYGRRGFTDLIRWSARVRARKEADA